MPTMLVNVCVALSLLSIPSYAASTALPGSSDSTLIVRLTAPADDPERVQVLREAAFSIMPVESRVLNAEEGVVQFLFKDRATASAQARRLRSLGLADSVQENSLYRPALHIDLQPVERQAESAQRAGAQLARAFSELLAPGPLFVAGADPLVLKDWAFQRSRFPEALDFDPARVTVAVLDTGVDYSHEDLASAMWHHPDRPAEVGYDFVHGNATPYDVRNFDLAGCFRAENCYGGTQEDMPKFLGNPGHGTHCAGHIGAVPNNSVGIRGAGGPASIMALKFFYDAGEENEGHGDDAAAIQSIDYAIKNGAKVINASWGGRQLRRVAERSELKKALERAKAAGVIVVIAAGNGDDYGLGMDQDKDGMPVYPAAFDLDNLIVVAATDQRDRLTGFSNYGAKSVHIAAPGKKVLSTVVNNGYSDVVDSGTAPDGRKIEITWDGTSMAAPLVAGAVALVWSKYPHEDYRSIRSRILKGARHVGSLEGKVATAGILDIAAALQAVP